VVPQDIDFKAEIYTEEVYLVSSETSEKKPGRKDGQRGVQTHCQYRSGLIDSLIPLELGCPSELPGIEARESLHPLSTSHRTQDESVVMGQQFPEAESSTQSAAEVS
jgi:hypothetical protein